MANLPPPPSAFDLASASSRSLDAEVVVEDQHAAKGAIKTGAVLPYDVNRQDQLDHYQAAGTPVKKIGRVPWYQRVLWEGGRPIDAFLTIVSAQVGQVILNLPNSMAKAGLPLGTFFQLWAAVVSMYTLWLLQLLYQEFKRSAIKGGSWFNDAAGERRTKVTQYHDIIGGVTGRRWLGEFARVVSITELVGLCVAQIIAGSSNLYSLHSGLPKRSWAFFMGSITMLMVLVPSMRNMRLFSLFTLFTTTFTAMFMVGVSLKTGLSLEAAQQPPRSTADVFSALANTFEVLDSQWAPSKFSKAFAWSQVYVTGLLTWPNAAFTFMAFPALSYKFGNAFAVYPAGTLKSVAIVTMVVDQLTAFGLFVHPLCILWEKLLRVHYKPNWIKLPSRIPVALFVWFIALAIPFFGVVNDLLGAFCVTFETFILPPLAFNLYYQGRPDRQAAAFIKPRRFSWMAYFAVNWFIIVVTLVTGLGFGGYASVNGFINSLNKFGFFAKCYNC
ncbi:transmembrane amino acid transporter protein-domain-containing protein [Scenedesmus sp. NREL 46B-D3]|nr:transmembrane amino acid transporter protein-domain-containing protein [Scenedesmus sp. NREL 46B-D3]